jgi:predicted Zn-dependent peptidase
VIAAAGNLSHERLLASLAATGWDRLERSTVMPDARPTPTPVPASVVHVPRDLQQTHFVFGSTTIPMRDPSRPAYLVVSALLGGGMSSRLFQRVREQLGLAYAVYSFHSLYSDVGVHGVYVGTSPDTAVRARQAVVDELSRLANEGIPEAELALGRQQLVGQYLLSQESVGARMNRMAVRELYGEPFRTVDEVIARIEGVTRGDALAVAQAWFAPERQTVVQMGPA